MTIQTVTDAIRYVGVDDNTLALFENQYPVQPMGGKDLLIDLAQQHSSKQLQSVYPEVLNARLWHFSFLPEQFIQCFSQNFADAAAEIDGGVVLALFNRVM